MRKFLLTVIFFLLASGVNLLYAGPRIEFGEEGWLQIDLKVQGIADYTPDFGSGIYGDDGRWDFYLRRPRFAFTGMLNDTWGVKVQT